MFAAINDNGYRQHRTDVGHERETEEGGEQRKVSRQTEIDCAE